MKIKTLVVVEHNNVRVLTTDQVAEAYGCKAIQLYQNFWNNSERFTEGVHYFRLEGTALKEFIASIGGLKISSAVKFTSVLYLWTKRGASRHCQMLGTDRAWDMFDLLEQNYFNPVDSYMIEDPIARAQRWIEKKKQLQAEKKIEIMAPKAKELWR